MFYFPMFRGISVLTQSRIQSCTRLGSLGLPSASATCVGMCGLGGTPTTRGCRKPTCKYCGNIGPPLISKQSQGRTRPIRPPLKVDPYTAVAQLP